MGGAAGIEIGGKPGEIMGKVLLKCVGGEKINGT